MQWRFGFRVWGLGFGVYGQRTALSPIPQTPFHSTRIECAKDDNDDGNREKGDQPPLVRDNPIECGRKHGFERHDSLPLLGLEENSWVM